MYYCLTFEFYNLVQGSNSIWEPNSIILLSQCTSDTQIVHFLGGQSNLALTFYIYVDLGGIGKIIIHKFKLYKNFQIRMFNGLKQLENVSIKNWTKAYCH